MHMIGIDDGQRRGDGVIAGSATFGVEHIEQRSETIPNMLSSLSVVSVLRLDESPELIQITAGVKKPGKLVLDSRDANQFLADCLVLYIVRRSTSGMQRR